MVPVCSISLAEVILRERKIVVNSDQACISLGSMHVYQARLQGFVFWKSFWNKYSQINTGTITHLISFRSSANQTALSRESDRMLSAPL